MSSSRNRLCCLISYIVVFIVLDGHYGLVFGFDSDEATAMLQKSLDCPVRSSPGMSVAVVKDGKTLYTKGFGLIDVDSETKATEDTLFSIASISKSFAAALLVKLLHEKTNLTINSKVRDLLGDEFQMPDAFRTHEMTFVDLMSHKTAMLSNNRVRFDTTFTRDTLLSRLPKLVSNREFRVDYIYNNIIYGLVGRLAEIVAGKKTKWEELIKEHFFDPLGMDTATFSTRLNYSRDDIAHGHWERDGKGQYAKVTEQLSRNWAEMCSSGSIKSSAKEMAHYMNFHLSQGKNNKGVNVMPEEQMNELHTGRFHISRINYLDIQKPMFPVTADSTSYALGLRVGTYRGLRMLSHSGSTFGYTAYMTLLPSENIGVISMYNGADKYYRHRAAVNHYLMDQAMGVDPYLNDSTICTFPKPWISKELNYNYRPTADNVSLYFATDEYSGSYTNEAFGMVEIEHNETLQSPVMTYGWGRWELLVINSSNTHGEQRFYAKGIEPAYAPDMSRLYFMAHPDDSSKVIGLRGTQFETKLPPIFCKKEHLTVCQKIAAMTLPKQDQSADCTNSNSNSGGSSVLITPTFILLIVIISLVF